MLDEVVAPATVENEDGNLEDLSPVKVLVENSFRGLAELGVELPLMDEMLSQPPNEQTEAEMEMASAEALLELGQSSSSVVKKGGEKVLLLK